MYRPTIFAQGILLFAFGLIFFIINLFIAWQINHNCTLSESEDNLIRLLLTIMNVLSAILMFFGFIGILSLKYPIINEYYGFMWFYKYGNFFPAIGFLVCSSYLLSIVNNNLRCTDSDANSSIQHLCVGILVMSILYFITSCILFYYLHKDTDEEVKQKAEEVFKQVSLYSENDIDIKLVNTYKSNKKDLEKASSLVDPNIDIKYNEKIMLLDKYINIAKLRDDSKKLYKSIQGSKLDYQISKINETVCTNKSLDEDQKVEMLKELNKLNSKLPKECENAPDEFKTTKSKTKAEELEEQIKLTELSQKLEKLKTPTPISDNFEKLMKPTSEIERANQRYQLAEIEAKRAEIESKRADFEAKKAISEATAAKKFEEARLAKQGEEKRAEIIRVAEEAKAKQAKAEAKARIPNEGDVIKRRGSFLDRVEDKAKVKTELSDNPPPLEKGD
jgi:hypothetical protein